MATFIDEWRRKISVMYGSEKVNSEIGGSIQIMAQHELGLSYARILLWYKHH